MSSRSPPGSGTLPSLPNPEPTQAPSKSYKPNFLEDPPAAPTRATFETIQGIITPPVAAAGPSFHRKARSIDTQAIVAGKSSGSSRHGAVATDGTPSPGDITGISPFNSFFAAAPWSSSTNTNTNTGPTRVKINYSPVGMSPEALHAAVFEYTKREVEEGNKAREKRVRNSMERTVNLGGDGTTPDELSEGDAVIWGPALASASEKSKQSGKGKGKKSERLVERFEEEYAAENAVEATPSLPPPTPRLRHASLSPTPTLTTTAESSGRPRYSASFEGRRRFGTTSRKREPLPVATLPRPGDSSDLPRCHFHASQPQTQVLAQKEQEKYGSPFDTWLSDLKKRVEKRVTKMEGREEETLLEKRSLCDRRTHLIAPILVVPRPKTSSSILLALRHIDFSRPWWQFGTAGQDRIQALLDAEEDNLEVVVEGDDLDGEGDEEMEGRIRLLLAFEHKKNDEAGVKGIVGVRREESGEEDIEDLDLGISVADDEGDDDLAANLEDIKRALGIKECLDGDDEDVEESAGASVAAGAGHERKGHAL